MDEVACHIFNRLKIHPVRCERRVTRWLWFTENFVWAIAVGCQIQIVRTKRPLNGDSTAPTELGFRLRWSTTTFFVLKRELLNDRDFCSLIIIVFSVFFLPSFNQMKINIYLFPYSLRLLASDGLHTIEKLISSSSLFWFITTRLVEFVFVTSSRMPLP